MYIASFKIITPIKEMNKNINDIENFYFCSSDDESLCFDETVDYIYETCRDLEKEIKRILKFFKNTEEDINNFLDKWYTKIMKTIILKEVTPKEYTKD